MTPRVFSADFAERVEHSPRRRAPCAPLIFFWFFLLPPFIHAETGFLVVHVNDVQKRPIIGLEIQEIAGLGDDRSAVTDQRGKARIRMAPTVKESSWVSLKILKSPPGMNWMIVSPWDYKSQVPSFENEAENFVEVVVVQHGERAALEQGMVLKALVQQINKANAPKSGGKQAAPPDPKVNLEAVAKQYGYTPEEVDKAIRAWGVTATDPYDVGVAALYERAYAKATANLQESLKQREEKLATAQKDVADAAFFLGQSLYAQGKYRDSAVAFQRCLQLRPDDATVLNNTALSLKTAADFAAAEPLYRRSLAIREKALGPDHPDVAQSLNNLASLLLATNRLDKAEPLMRRALAINEKTLGPDHPDVAMDLNNLAQLLQATNRLGEAEPLMRRAIAIDEEALGPSHPDVARYLDNLANLLQATNRLGEAEPLYRRALAIDEKALGPDHPTVAMDLNNLAQLLQAANRPGEAESLMRRALAIDEKALGPEHPQVAIYLSNLATLLYDTNQFSEAEPLMRRALAIDEKALGLNHPNVAIRLSNLAMLLQATNRLGEAEPLMRRALSIDEKALGADHPAVAIDLNNLANLLQATNRLSEAEPLMQRSLVIFQTSLGPKHPNTVTARKNLAALLRQEGKSGEADKLLAAQPHL
jgi:tetratricopeptide (TPR) repeat protein